jgi:hypothetical protein
MRSGSRLGKSLQLKAFDAQLSFRQSRGARWQFIVGDAVVRSRLLSQRMSREKSNDNQQR